MQNLETFLAERLPESSVAAWGVRLGAGKPLVRCHQDWFAPEQVEQTLDHLMRSAGSLSLHSIDPLRLCWVFDRIRIFLALRPDNECLGVIVENRPGLAFNEIEAVLDEYLALPQT